MDDLRKLTSNLSTRLEELTQAHEEFNGLSRVALALLDQNDLEALDDLNIKRQAMFKRITMLQKKLQPAFDRWPEVSAALPPADLNGCNQQIAKIRGLGQETLELDRQAMPLMERARDAMREQIKKLDAGKRLIRAYSRTPVAVKPPAGFSRNG